MKRINQLGLVTLLMLFMTISCEESIEITNHEEGLDPKIEAAKEFFQNEIENSSSIYSLNAKTGKNRKTIKKNLLWNKAWVKQLTHGQGIVVPVKFEEEQFVPNGNSSISLSNLTHVLIYEDKQGVNKLEIVTALPDEAFQTSINPDKKFSGIILVENWNGEVLKAFRQTENEIYPVEVEDKKRNTSGRESNECITTYYFNCTTVSSEYGSYTSCEYDHSETTCPFSGGGGIPSSGSNYNYNYGDNTGTGGGSGGPSSNDPEPVDNNPSICDEGYISNTKGECVPAMVIISPDTPITDMAKYLECFNTSENATITIYADQPKEGYGDAYALTWSGVVVGHTFVSITQGNNTSVFGFYPSTNETSNVSPPEPSVIGNDSGSTFDISVSVTVSGNTLSQIIQYAVNYQNMYDLSNYNCTDFGIEIGNLAGLGLPDCYGTWLGGGGSNPGTLGEHIRNMPLAAGTSRNTTGGIAPNNKKGC